MKKIIELAEKYFESVKNNESIFSQVKRKKELHAAIKEYRTLQAAPITEEWLKEHGWEVNHHEGDVHNWDFYNSFDGRYAHIYLNALCKPQFWEVNYKGNIILHLSTLADLLNALELCGITMKD